MLPKRSSFVDTMDEVTHSNNRVIEGTSEPHIIVACPSCKTKFAVESTLVASYEVPRFHCSRCDFIFELQAQHSKQTPQGKSQPSEAQRWVLDDTARESRLQTSRLQGSKTQRATNQVPEMAGPDNDDHRQTLATQTALKATDFTLGTIPNSETGVETFEPRTPFEPIEDQAGLSILGFRPSASRRHSTSITRAEAQAIAAHALPNLQPSTPLNSKPPPTLQPDQPERHEDPFALFDAPGSTPSIPGVLNPPSQTVSTPQPNPPAAKIAAPQPRESIAQPRVSRFSRLSLKTQGLARLTVPLLAAIGVLCIISFATQLMPLTMDSVFASLTPRFISGRTAHIPPRELSVQDLNLSLEKTQSKETVPVIRGVVSNLSDKTFEDVSIEALGFNARGELLVRARAPLRSALSREKISDLPLETVKKFQSVLSASDASIKGNEKVAFAVALFAEGFDPHEVTYFSARVFSVGRTR